MPRKRLDQLLVDRGLAPSRERARALILAGQVTVDGAVVSKAGTPVRDESAIALVAPDHPYVSRGGVKLARALEAFGLDPAGRHALDVGASTGGFTDVLLRRGAASVIALDVGRGQLDWRLRHDPRVIVREGVNARALTRDDVPESVDLATIDVAFISLRHILPPLAARLRPGADIVALVKPQFEAGREDVGKGGIVRDPAVHEAVIARVSAAAAALGLERVAATPSPIAGMEGNREFFLHLRTPVVVRSTSMAPIRSVGIVAKSHLRAAAPHLAAILRWLDERHVEAVCETATAALFPGEAPRLVADYDDLVRRVGMVLVLGGDGTLLGAVDRLAAAGVDIPILGVNFGSLGFLTEVTLPELYPSLEAAIAGHAPIEARLMLQGTVSRGGAAIVRHAALNDVVVKAARSRIMNLLVSAGDEFVTRVKADGLIIATPTGSTAYNLAAGGPIVQPAVDAIVLTPIAPHTLTNRPVVIPASLPVRVQPLMGERDEVLVTFDGQATCDLRPGDEVEVDGRARALRLVRPSTRSYFEVLRQKLKWGER